MAGRQAWGYISAIAGTGEVRRSAKRATIPSGRRDCDGNERYGLTAQNQAWNGGGASTSIYLSSSCTNLPLALVWYFI